MGLRADPAPLCSFRSLSSNDGSHEGRSTRTVGMSPSWQGRRGARCRPCRRVLQRASSLGPWLRLDERNFSLAQAEGAPGVQALAAWRPALPPASLQSCRTGCGRCRCTATHTAAGGPTAGRRTKRTPPWPPCNPRAPSCPTRRCAAPPRPATCPLSRTDGVQARWKPRSGLRTRGKGRLQLCNSSDSCLVASPRVPGCHLSFSPTRRSGGTGPSP